MKRWSCEIDSKKWPYKELHFSFCERKRLVPEKGNEKLSGRYPDAIYLIARNDFFWGVFYSLIISLGNTFPFFLFILENWIHVGSMFRSISSTNAESSSPSASPLSCFLKIEAAIFHDLVLRSSQTFTIFIYLVLILWLLSGFFCFLLLSWLAHFLYQDFPNASLSRIVYQISILAIGVVAGDGELFFDDFN